MHKFGLLLGMLPVAALQTSAFADPVTIVLRPSGLEKPAEIGFGQGASLSPMTLKGDAYSTQVDVDSVLPEDYAVRLRYGSENYLIPLRLHKHSSKVDLHVDFDGPRNCRDALVRQSETAAQQNNIEEALAKYLLAAHLSRIIDEAGKCRGSQPARLRKARIERGIQLATFRDSPFLPPEGTIESWSNVIGRGRAAAYAAQVRGNAAVLLDSARKRLQRNNDFASAAEINSTLLENLQQDTETNEKDYALVGLTEKRLSDNQHYLETMAEAFEPSSSSASESTPP